jgi:pimeloyl-ACP methyl ester carboxylesterase
MSAAPVRHSIRHGDRRLSYQQAGPSDGPVVLLLHGLVSDSTTWQPTIAPLAARGLRVIALDLLGHGQSDKPPIGYSLDDFGASITEVLDQLAITRVTLVGHSLGGAIAMHFAHHDLERVERLVLVSSGGLGKQVHLMLRGATLPGVSTLLRLTVNRGTAHVYGRRQLHRALRLRPEAVTNLSRIGRSLLTTEGRTTFIAATRAVIGPSGQLGSMIEMDYLAEHLPTLIVWSEHDPIIPVSHAHATHDYLPSSRLEVFPGTSHEPHRRHPLRFATAVADFIEQTPAAPPPG